MITVKEDTTLVGISELRTHFRKVIGLISKTKVLLERRNKPLAVIVPIEKYDRMEAMIEEMEDIGLGYLARERESRSTSHDYIDLVDAKKALRKR